VLANSQDRGFRSSRNIRSVRSRPESLISSRHAPRKRGIQYAAASRLNTAVSRILDCLHAWVMTARGGIRPSCAGPAQQQVRAGQGLRLAITRRTAESTAQQRPDNCLTRLHTIKNIRLFFRRCRFSNRLLIEPDLS
jgi:hypothetical protein